MAQAWLLRVSIGLNVLVLLAVMGKLVQRYAFATTTRSNQFHRKDRWDLLQQLPVTAESTVMAGDSLTERAEWAELLRDPSVLNRGVAGDTTADFASRAGRLVAAEPRRLFIMVGINDLAQGRSAAEICVDYERALLVIRARSPRTRVFVQSVLPPNQALTTESVRSADVRMLNQELRLLAARTGGVFVDVAAALSDDHGELAAKFTRDGIHLNGAGYAAWAGTLAEAAP